MLVTPSGIEMLVRPEHESNARNPILVTLLGIVTLVRLEQLRNAPLPMLVTGFPTMVDGISTGPTALVG